MFHPSMIIEGGTTPQSARSSTARIRAGKFSGFTATGLAQDEDDQTSRLAVERRTTTPTLQKLSTWQAILGLSTVEWMLYS